MRTGGTWAARHSARDQRTPYENERERSAIFRNFLISTTNSPIMIGADGSTFEHRQSDAKKIVARFGFYAAPHPSCSRETLLAGIRSSRFVLPHLGTAQPAASLRRHSGQLRLPSKSHPPAAPGRSTSHCDEGDDSKAEQAISSCFVSRNRPSCRGPSSPDH